MLKRTLLSASLLGAVPGCSLPPPANPAASADHPANPDAPEAPLAPTSPVLAAPSSTQPAPAMDPSMPGMHHGRHE